MIAPVSSQIILASLAGALGAQEPAGPVAILEHADVRIAIDGRRASVEATYQLDRAAGLLLLDAMRIPGQTLEIEEGAGPATVLRRLDDVVGLHRVAARTGLNRPAEERGPVELHLR